MTNSERPVFVVKFECKNCGAVWEEKYYKGDRVEENYWGVYVKDHRCTHKISCPYCHKVQCPVCGIEQDVVVRKKMPLVNI